VLPLLYHTFPKSTEKTGEKTDSDPIHSTSGSGHCWLEIISFIGTMPPFTYLIVRSAARCSLRSSVKSLTNTLLWWSYCSCTLVLAVTHREWNSEWTACSLGFLWTTRFAFLIGSFVFLFKEYHNFLGMSIVFLKKIKNIFDGSSFQFTKVDSRPQKRGGCAAYFSLSC
jgi:hypothetical protein